MADWLDGRGIQDLAYVLEVSLCVLLLRQGQWRRLASVWMYLVFLLGIDGIGRPYVLYRYGLASRQYAYFFWLTDVLLALAAFVLVCAFFHRACAREQKLWRFTRLLLVFVFILVLGISLFSLSRNYNQLFTLFIVEFGQNLYFTCLVLNTLLYILMQQIETADDELGLLVCGTGIQFAGPAACLALFYLTGGQAYVRSLTTFILPLCTLGMLLTWLYAIARMPKAAVAPSSRGRVPAPVQAVVRGAEG